MTSSFQLAIIAIALRAVLLVYGSWQDFHLAVKYTDIDYDVYTDAAQFMLAGDSPYHRSTYRYTPLLAALLTPNRFLHRSFGKIIFCVADILAASLMQRMLQRRGASTSLQATALAIWLFSPFTASISTRGNGEAVVTCMLLGMLELLENGWHVCSGLLLGLAVHWRLYPIFYALPVMRHLALLSSSAAAAATDGITSSSTTTNNKKENNNNKLLSIFWLNNGVFSVAGFKFALPAATIFLTLGTGFYCLYGYPFLHETYLYHATRIDPRHNFSPYFLPAYLGTEANHDTFFHSLLGDGGKFFSIFALILQIALGWRFAANLPAAFLLQTVALVAFNKVATAQYFVWYLSWLPLVLPDLVQAQNARRIVIFTVLWAGALGHWLAWAYQLEFGGAAVYVHVWVAGLVWVVANAALLRELIVALQQLKSPTSMMKKKGL